MPTREERKRKRQERRQERKELSLEVKEKWQAVKNAIESSNIAIDLDTEPKFVDTFNKVWPVLRPVLDYAKAARITGEKADKKIQAIIELGDRISTGKASKDEQGNLGKTLDKVWKKVRIALSIAVAFTNEKIDKVLNDIIDIGDWITEEAKA